MAKPPKQQPLVDIPGIDDAKELELRVKGAGAELQFQMFVGGEQVYLDADNEWMDRDWYGIVIRELDRREVWHYSIEPVSGVNHYIWKRTK